MNAASFAVRRRRTSLSVSRIFILRIFAFFRDAGEDVPPVPLRRTAKTRWPLECAATIGGALRASVLGLRRRRGFVRCRRGMRRGSWRFVMLRRRSAGIVIQWRMDVVVAFLGLNGRRVFHGRARLGRFSFGWPGVVVRPVVWLRVVSFVGIAIAIDVSVGVRVRPLVGVVVDVRRRVRVGILGCGVRHVVVVVHR